jgi:hypothetical protein
LSFSISFVSMLAAIGTITLVAETYQPAPIHPYGEVPIARPQTFVDRNVTAPPPAITPAAPELVSSFVESLHKFTKDEIERLRSIYRDRLMNKISAATASRVDWWHRENAFVDQVAAPDDVERFRHYIKWENSKRGAVEVEAAQKIANAFNRAVNILLQSHRQFLITSNETFRRSGYTPGVTSVGSWNWEREINAVEQVVENLFWQDERRAKKEFYSVQHLIPPKGRQEVEPKIDFDKRFETISDYVAKSEDERGAKSHPARRVKKKTVEGISVSVNSPVYIIDSSKRDVRGGGLILTDDDGVIANPAIPLFIRATAKARLPVRVWLSSSEPRIYFDEPSTTGTETLGPTKSKIFAPEINVAGAILKNRVFGTGEVIKTRPQAREIILETYEDTFLFYVSIFPDDDGDNERHSITVSAEETVQPPPIPRKIPSPPSPANSTETIKVVVVAPEPEPPPEPPQKVITSFDMPVEVLDFDKPFPNLPCPEVRRASSWPNIDEADGPYSEGPRTYYSFPFMKNTKMVAEQPWELTIKLDYNQDRGGFFLWKKNRDIAQLACQHWAYNFADQGFDEVPRGAETTTIRYQEQRVGYPPRPAVIEQSNAYPFNGYVIYLVSANTSATSYAMSNANDTGFQKKRGEEVPIRRTGAVTVEGINQQPGFVADPLKTLWSLVLGRLDKPLDLYHLLLHEFGHTLFWDLPGYAVLESWLNQGMVRDLVVAEAQGRFPVFGTDMTFSAWLPGPPRDHQESGADQRARIAKYYERVQKHLSLEIDVRSRRPAFGALYSGFHEPPGRALITKLDLLLAQAMGWILKKTSAFLELAIVPRESNFDDGYVGEYYRDKVTATGGTQSYYWHVWDGKLPQGLDINSLTGEVYGYPMQKGHFSFVLEVVDQFAANAYYADTIAVH